MNLSLASLVLAGAGLSLVAAAAGDGAPAGTSNKPAVSAVRESAPDKEVAAWFRDNTLPLRDVNPGGAADDLRPLQRTLAGVRIVGMGETTHGTKEIYQVRHRLLRYLVEEMGFTGLAIEASHSAAQRVNDYVLNGAGDRAAALTGLGTSMWDTQEFSAVLDWMRTYNQSAPAARKVRFHGLDMCDTHVGREKVLVYLRTVAPERVAPTEQLFQRIADGEALGWSLAHQKIDAELLRQFENLSDFVAARRDAFTRRTSAAQFEQIADHLRVLRQWLVVNLPEQTPPGLTKKPGLNNFVRSKYLAENLIHVVEKDEPRAKVAVWAHTYHLGVGFPDTDPAAASTIVPTMGQYLREHFGPQYYVFAVELNGGPYLARVGLPDKSLGDFKVVDLPAAPTGSVPWYLAHSGRDYALLDLRGTPPPPHIARWLDAPQVMHVVSWVYALPPRWYFEMAPPKVYDGIIFVGNGSASTPTPNALKAVAARASH